MQPLRIKNEDSEEFIIYADNRPSAEPSRSYFPTLKHKPLSAFLNALTPQALQRLKDYVRVLQGNTGFINKQKIINLLQSKQLQVRIAVQQNLEGEAQVLRSKIQATLNHIIQIKKSEAREIEAQHQKRNLLEKGLAYQSAFRKGISDSAISLLTWLKEVNDVISLQQRLHRVATAAWDARSNQQNASNWLAGFQENLRVAEYRELIEALGFDPSTLSKQDIVAAYEISLLVWEDAPTQRLLVNFAKDYANAQHSLEWARMGGGAAFEILLTAVLALFTGGLGAAAAMAGKTRLLKPLMALGKQFQDLAKVIKQAKLRRNRNNSRRSNGTSSEPAYDWVQERHSEPPSRAREWVDDGGASSAQIAPEKTTTPKLLPGEGRVGTYRDLVKSGVKGDNLTPHHMPADSFMKQQGVKRNDGVAMNLEQPSPGTGGRHRRTRTYGRGADLNETPRQALARDIRDARKIYQEDGLYTPEIRKSLQEVIKKNKELYPDIFK